MINITLSDGVIKQFPSGVTAEEIAKSISPSLAKKAVAAEVNGSLIDTYIPINHDASVKIITTDSKEGLEIIRHDAAHIIAQAVKELFPETQVTIGPVIEDGFYYDFARDIPFTISDLQVIEKKMQEIVARNDIVRREVWSRNAAIEFFAQQGEKYKVSIIQELPEAEEITLYRQGNFVDLCRGPHAPSTSHVKHFKLMKVAGAYWRGNSKNTMLQRIYGTAWSTKDDLDAYLYRITEAQKRDHRKLGRELDLFHFQDEAQGMPFWHDKGWTIFKIVREYISNKIQRAGYIEVNTPIILSQKLWEQSGHWEKFRENMFTVGTDTEVTDANITVLTAEHQCSAATSVSKPVNIAKADTKTCSFAIKPMNCPAHIQIFNYALRSYRDLPLRMAEFGACHRYEPSGSLYGLMRARGFTQDDAHIFCTEEQITDETIQFCQLLKQVYADFGFLDIKIKFSDRPSKRAGTDEVWDKAEKALLHAIQALGAEYSINSGEGAFYGPKLEFILKDAIGREWQCGTLQVDFVLPERLNAYYVNSEGIKQRPVILHRAILGSLERFIGILIEHYAGKLPIWLAPVQVAVLSITDESIVYAKDVYQKLTDSSVRTKLDITNQKINYKIRNFSLAKVPVIAVIGKKEVDSKKIVIRKLDSDVQKTIDVEELINYIRENDKINIIK